MEAFPETYLLGRRWRRLTVIGLAVTGLAVTGLGRRSVNGLRWWGLLEVLELGLHIFQLFRGVFLLLLLFLIFGYFLIQLRLLSFLLFLLRFLLPVFD